MGRKPSTAERRNASITFNTTIMLKTDLAKIAFMMRCTSTDVINEILKQYVEEHKQEVKRYNTFFENKPGEEV